MDNLNLTEEERKVLVKYFTYGRDNWVPGVNVGTSPPDISVELGSVMDKRRFDELVEALAEKLIEIKNMSWETRATNAKFCQAYLDMLSTGEN